MAALVDATTSLRPSYQRSRFKPNLRAVAGINCHSPAA